MRGRSTEKARMIEPCGKMFFYEGLVAEKPWDDFANRYETARRLRLVFGQLLDASELAGSRFLDAGSGGGHFSEYAAGLGAKVWSLDVGDKLLAEVAGRCKSHRVIGSVLDIPFEDGFFDIVLCTEVIEHTPVPLQAVKELSRVVRSGGILVITTPCKLWQAAVRLASFLRLRPFQGLENFVWPGQLVETLVSQGLRIEWSGGFNFWPLFNRRLEPAFRMCDSLYGRRLPWAMVNIAVRARRNEKR